MQRVFFIICLLALSCGSAMAQDKDETAIRKILADQVVAWNKGDLVRFMQGYWNSDSLMFIGKNGPTYGYKPTLERYQKGYPDEAHMGRFTSTVLSMQRISSDCYYVLGRWELKRSAGDVSGHYTLLFRKIRGSWVIVSDHSS